jgi:mannosyltransferase
MAAALATDAPRGDVAPADQNGSGRSPAPATRTLQGSWLTVAGIVVAAAVATGLVLRFWTRSELWLDEALAVNIAHLPLSQLHEALKEDGAPPLYYVLLHYWMVLFGTSNAAVRALSGLLSVLTLPVAWVAGRRYGGSSAAWAVLLLLATSPFAIYYGTEARMYALVMFLTACGFVALDRALRRPRPGNLVAVAVVTAALLYTQYWALYLVAVLGLYLLLRNLFGRGRGLVKSWWALGAVVVGCLAFVPWWPTFVFQSRHTGTPWGAPTNFAAVINTITGFTDNQATLSTAGSSQGRLLAVLYLVFGALAVFGIARDRWHVDLDLRTQPKSRGMAFVVVGTLFVAIGGGIVSHSAFSVRYASVIYVPLLLLVALGLLVVEAPKIRAVILLAAAAAGLAVAVPNISTQRTQAAPVVNVLKEHAQPGDVVAFCPDQLGPATYRLMTPDTYKTTTFPRGTSPAFVDWVDYKSTIQHTNAVSYAQGLVNEAGAGHRVWLVWAPGYQGFSNKCEQIVNELTAASGNQSKTWIVQNPNVYYEPMNLQEFTPSP